MERLVKKCLSCKTIFECRPEWNYDSKYVLMQKMSTLSWRYSRFKDLETDIGLGYGKNRKDRYLWGGRKWEEGAN